MTTRDSEEGLEKLVYELLRKVDTYHEAINTKMDNKLDSLEIKMCEEIRLLRKDGYDRYEIQNHTIKLLDDRVDGHETRISKIEHSWVVVTVVVTGLVGSLNWIMHFLGIK